MNLIPKGTRRGEPVLVVEDDVALLRLIRKWLDKHGYETAGALTGSDALDWLDRHKAGLMLLDYSLPDMTGQVLLDRLDEAEVQVPFVVTTGHGSEAVAVEMMKRGALDYLIKGSSFLKMLPAVVSRALGQVERNRHLAEELREVHEQLEDRVRRRTAELADANERLRREMADRRRTEEQLRRHEAEFDHLARLNTAGEMAAELAHELNQPLSAIASYGQACSRMLRTDPKSHTETLLDSIEQIGEQANRAGEIIRRLRGFVAKARPEESQTDINELVRDVAGLVELEARAAGVLMRIDLAKKLPLVAADRLQIEQVLINLMRNGLEAMRESEFEPRVLTVRTGRGERNEVTVSIHDTGDGISSANLCRVFDRFFTTKSSGMGMGLPISRSILEKHGGRLWFTPDPKRGVTFQFTLPVEHGEAGDGK